MKSYLGQKGYSIYKNTLTVKEQIFYDDYQFPTFLNQFLVLIMHLFVMRITNKFYLPRFFGESNFGEISNQN